MSPSSSTSSGGGAAGAGALHETDTTILQKQTEKECQPYFMDLTTLTSQEQHDLVRIGLLPEPLSPNETKGTGSGEEHDQEPNNSNNTMLEIQLLREQHREYLAQVWTRALRAPFVSLDSSRPWILYWCLQGYDLLSQNTATDTTTKTTKGWITPQDGRKMVTTLEDCWTGYWVTEEEIPPLVTDQCSTDDKEDLFFQEHDDDEHRRTTTATKTTATGPRYYCGGFGGGPGQMAHAATTYAAVLALCILATDNEEEETNAEEDSSSENEDEETSSASSNNASYTKLSYPLRAQRVLHEIRLPLYRWMCSLQVYHPTKKDTDQEQEHEHKPEQQQHKEEGAYRMQHDGEIDVRATYTIACCAKLLGLVTTKTNTILGRRAVRNFVISCQTYEGGFGGEPYAEAHGGYTFCGVAALTLLCPRHELQWTGLHYNTENTTTEETNAEDDVVFRLDIAALTGWLTRRQMRYEGGFSGRTNKLVDGCYSFWQGGATAIVSSCYEDFYGGVENTEETENDDDNNTDKDNHDPWLRRYYQQQHQHKQHDADDNDNTGNTGNMDSTMDMPFPLLYNVRMLERYILLCAQEPTGGLRDKPSKSRDFYHTNYNLCGLSIAQHYSSSSSQNDTNTVATDTVDNSGDASRGRSAGIDETFGDQQQTKVEATHPIYNIRIDRVAKILAMDW